MAGRELSGTGYLQGKPCPKCGYARGTADSNPDWQCPKCRIAYLKYRPATAQLGARLAAGGREMAAEARTDRSIYSLIAANLVALLIAWLTHMSLRDLMMVYWIQSVIIGISFYFRMLSLRRFSTQGLTVNDQPVREDAKSKRQVANFFALHFGLFHGGYLIFIVADMAPESKLGSVFGYILCALVFAANHGYSLFQNVRGDTLRKPNLGIMMFLPYVRIVPMHATIILGGAYYAGAQAFLIFGLLKLVADAIMHTVEHHVLAKGSVLPPAS